MKDQYENIEMEVIAFDNEDIVTASGDPHEGELD